MKHMGSSRVKPPRRRAQYLARSRANKGLVARLRSAGVTYTDVANLAGVSWRMVKFVIDGDKTSAKVMAAIDRLAPERNGTAA
jgi:hypothetical protein